MKAIARKGYFGAFGGIFVPETLMGALEDLDKTYRAAQKDRRFAQELNYYLEHYVGRPTPLYYAKRLSDYLGGPKIYLKREDLCHTGAHKINNTLGQILLARRMGKRRIIAETGAGQHGVATATVAAMFGMECTVFMGAQDMARQALNVFRMRLLGAEVRRVEAGSQTLKDAINEAMRDWVTHVRGTHYILGSVLGPHPYPEMVRNFQRVIGREAKKQILQAEGRLPDLLVACVGGGSNALGLFTDFFGEKKVRMVGVEAGGLGVRSGQHAARFEGGSLGILHGTKSFVLQDADGQVRETHSISAGLDYPSIGPEHVYLRESGRVSYTSVQDKAAMEGFALLSRFEGIIPALESAHAVAYAAQAAKKMKRNQIVIINISGRGDKDIDTATRYFEK